MGERLSHLLALALAIVAGAGIVTTMLVTVADVTRRGVVGASIPGVLEYTEVAVVVIAFGGMALAQHERAHVSTNVATSRLPTSVARVAKTAGALLAAALLLYTGWLCSAGAVESIERGEVRFGLAEVPVWPARVGIAAGLLLLALAIIVTIPTWWRRESPTSPESSAGRSSPGTSDAQTSSPRDVRPIEQLS